MSYEFLQTTILIIIFGFLAFSALSNILIFASTNSFYRHRARPTYLIPGRHLVLVLRVLNETDTIARSIDYIHRAIRGMPNVSVIVVGTERERVDGHNPTLALARALTSEFENWLLIEAPLKPNGTHAHQTNFAIGSIKTSPTATWILTLDIDSQFGRDGIYAFVEQINAGIRIVQQHAIFSSNYRRIGAPQKSHAIIQSAWTIRHELKRAYLNRIASLSVAHVVGHGLCINLATLNEYGGFPEETPFEDISLGFYLVSSGEQIVSLPVFEIGDTPPTLSAGLKQEFSWSYAAMSYPAYFHHFKRRFPDKYARNSLRAACYCVMGIWSYIRWLVGSWFSILLVSIAAQGDPLAIAACAAISLEYSQVLRLMLYTEQIRRSDLISAPLLIFIGIIRRSLPADAALLSWLFTGKVKKIKTPHN